MGNAVANETILTGDCMDSAAKQRIKDMRFDIAKLELKLNNTDVNDTFPNDKGEFVNCRSVIYGQLLELRQRLKAEIEFYESEE